MLFDGKVIMGRIPLLHCPFKAQANRLLSSVKAQANLHQASLKAQANLLQFPLKVQGI